MAARLQHQAQALSAQLPPLLIEAERVAQTVHQGIHGRRRAGAGETFWQFRRYEPGDPITRIDWRQSARTDKIFIREREWEAVQSAYIWADASPSMHYASSKKLPQKVERARLLMLALASLMLRGGEKVIWMDRENIAAYGKKGLDQIASRMGAGFPESLPPQNDIARHAQIILCSDFLMPPDELERLMRRYASLQANGILVHVMDPMEVDFSLHGRVELQGCKGEAPLLLPNAGALHDAYAQRFAEHKSRIEHLARSTGWFYTAHRTDQSPHETLMLLYQRLTATSRSF